MDIIAAYREAGTYRGAAQIAGTTHKTVKRVIARQEAGGAAPQRVPRARNHDGVAALVAERVKKTSGRISAKRLLPAARAAGYNSRHKSDCAIGRALRALLPGGRARPGRGFTCGRWFRVRARFRESIRADLGARPGQPGSGHRP